MTVHTEKPLEFDLRLRLPWWLSAPARIQVNGTPEKVPAEAPGFHTIRRKWHEDRVEVELPRTITTSPIPDDPARMAFLDGPVVLAGLCEEERRLTGDPERPEEILAPDNNVKCTLGATHWRTVGQEKGLQMRPLFQIGDEAYTVYFPVGAQG